MLKTTCRLAVLQVVNSLAVAREASGRKAQPENSIRLRAEEATAEGQPLFFTPVEGIPIGSTGTLFYNAAHTPLPCATARLCQDHSQCLCQCRSNAACERDCQDLE